MNTILITGAGRGLGLELAAQYAKDGWKVIGTVRDDAGKMRLAEAGGEAHTLDVANFEAARELARRLKGRPLDILFCNAGVIGNRGMALGSFDYASWEQVMRVNVLGAAAVAEALVENVAASEKKVIAMMSSRLGSITESSGATLPYATSKAALNMLVKGLGATLAARGIKVVALSPGWVRTDMGGEGASLAPQTSVAGLRKVLAGLQTGDSGKFFSYEGSAIPW
ncbi:MAG TPA: SDR family oxidoreductase [Burkholderiales bacterium]|nr:SDR family oxidoreductase [Burkholderiales bacterium]